MSNIFWSFQKVLFVFALSIWDFCSKLKRRKRLSVKEREGPWNELQLIRVSGHASLSLHLSVGGHPLSVETKPDWFGINQRLVNPVPPPGILQADPSRVR